MTNGDWFFLMLGMFIFALHAVHAFGHFLERNWGWFCFHLFMTILLLFMLVSLVSIYDAKSKIIEEDWHIMDKAHPQFLSHSVCEITHLPFPLAPVLSYVFDRTVGHLRGHLRNVIGNKQFILKEIDHQVVPCRFEGLPVGFNLVDTQNRIKKELPGGVVNQPVGFMLSLEQFMPVRLPEFAYSPETAKQKKENFKPGCRIHLS